MKTFTKTWRSFLVVLQLFIFTILISNSNAATAQTIRYVKKGAAGTNDGTSWENAYSELADALKWAEQNKANWAGDPLKILVAKGTYKPLYKMAEANADGVASTARDNSFVLVKNVQLYGGFDPDNGISSLDNARIFGNNGTILSGDLDGNDASDIPVSNLLAHETRANNAYRVVLSAGDVGSACLDGFTITGGNGNKDGNYLPVNGQNVYPAMGGGIANIASSPKLTNLTVHDNAGRQSGGGIYNWGSYPQISNSTITRNWTNQFGGGISETYSQSTISNVIISYNGSYSSGGGLHTGSWASIVTNVAIHHNYAGTRGGGIHNEGASEFKNVTVTDNTMGSTGVGGGLHNIAGEPRLMNVTICRNSAVYYTAGVYVSGGKPKFFNSIIWGNTMTNGTINNVYKISGALEFQYNLIQGSAVWKASFGTDLGNNIDRHPLFVNAAGGDYTLSENSPAMDAGNNALYQNAGGNLTTDKDLSGQLRVRGNAIDMGAYEVQKIIYGTGEGSILYVDKSVQGGNGSGSSWSNAIPELGDALKWANDNKTNWTANALKIYVAKGVYKPLYKAAEITTDNQPATDRDKTFLMVNNVELYGGFDHANGISTVNNDRIFDQTGTVLSGDILGNDAANIDLAELPAHASIQDNVYHVVAALGEVGTARLDGFTIEKGNGNVEGEVRVNTKLLNRMLGAGMYNMGASPALTNVIFQKNIARWGGGGMYNYEASPTLSNVQFLANIVKGEDRTYGGGLVNENSSSPKLTNVSFISNIVYGKTQGYAGGMLNTQSSNAILDHVVFKNNRAGGDSYSYGGGAFNSSSAPRFTDVEFTQNISDAQNGNAGGLFNYDGSSPVLTNITFKENSAVYAGGIYNSNSSSPSMNNVVISGNSASITAGGMVNGENSSPLLTNVVITGNTSAVSIGGIANISGSSPVLVNVTVSGNTGGAMDNGANCTPQVKNSIIYGNSEGASGGNVTYQNSLVQGVAGGNNGNLDGSVSPQFVNPLAPGLSTDGDYSLKPLSPAVNTGDSAAFADLATAKDLAGNPRLIGASIDLGAYESQNQPDVTKRYVKAGAFGNGFTWDGASGDLQKMINESSAGNEIWVAGGTHKPNRSAADPNTITSNDRANAFVMKEGVKIYGGFAGNESQLELRNVAQHETILSGALEGGNSFHVVLAVGTPSSPLTLNTKLDGFTITAGVANTTSNISVNTQTVYNNNGGGLYNYNSSAEFANIKLTDNHSSNTGGAIFNWSSASVFTNLTVTGNFANSGAGIANYDGSASYYNVRTSGNKAIWGGGFYNLNASPTITGALISGNTADFGGGMYNSSSSPILTNTTIGSNTGYGIFNTNTSSASQIRNSIIFGNSDGVSSGTTTYSNSLVQGITGGTAGNLDGDIDPLFVNLPAPGLSTAGDFSLTGCSQVVNAGDNVFIGAETDKDLSGNARIYSHSVDLGAYEFQSPIQTGADRLAVNNNSNTIVTERDKTYRVTAQGEICRSVAVIRSIGQSPVESSVVLTTWVDATLQSYKGAPYVQRHYDISPAANAETATAEITLYFTQAEFTTFNAATGSGKIPADPDDATGKSHLRIYQYHGNGVDGNGPGSYTGAPVTIDPSDEKIVWNKVLERWEVTFDVSGFSGFFAGSEASPLPVKLVSFAGKLTDQQTVELNWTVAEQSGILEYVVEYSADGRSFSEVGRMQASTDLQDNYQFEAVHPFSSTKAYYRLHILENEADSYSRIISINVPDEARPVVYPLPARDFIWIKGAKLSGNEVKLINVQGSVLKSIVLQSDEQQIDISTLSPGTYFLQMPFGGVQKIVKQ